MMATGRPTRHAGTTAEFRQLDVRQLQREGLLTVGGRFMQQWVAGRGPASLQGEVDADSVAISYSIAKEEVSAPLQRHYRLLLIKTPCRYGGYRAWFQCPNNGCSRKVAILYADLKLACRKCQGLTYQCQRLNLPERQLLRCQKVRLMLGGSPNFWDPIPSKPNGMHAWMYTQQVIKILAAERPLMGFALALAEVQQRTKPTAHSFSEKLPG